MQIRSFLACAASRCSKRWVLLFRLLCATSVSPLLHSFRGAFLCTLKSLRLRPPRKRRRGGTTRPWEVSGRECQELFVTLKPIATSFLPKLKFVACVRSQRFWINELFSDAVLHRLRTAQSWRPKRFARR